MRTRNKRKKVRKKQGYKREKKGNKSKKNYWTRIQEDQIPPEFLLVNDGLDDHRRRVHPGQSHEQRERSGDCKYKPKKQEISSINLNIEEDCKYKSKYTRRLHV